VNVPAKVVVVQPMETMNLLSNRHYTQNQMHYFLLIRQVMVQDLVEHYVNETKDEVGKKVAIELKDTVSNIF